MHLCNMSPGRRGFLRRFLCSPVKDRCNCWDITVATVTGRQTIYVSGVRLQGFTLVLGPLVFRSSR